MTLQSIQRWRLLNDELRRGIDFRPCPRRIGPFDGGEFVIAIRDEALEHFVPRCHCMVSPHHFVGKQQCRGGIFLSFHLLNFPLEIFDEQCRLIIA